MPHLILFEHPEGAPLGGYIATSYSSRGEVSTTVYETTTEALIAVADLVRRGYQVSSLGNREYLLTLEKLMVHK